MRNYFISGHHYIQDVVLEAGTYTFWAYIKSDFGNTFTFALANEAGEWEVFDVDVQQGQWTKAYEVFTIKERKNKLSLIYRYFDSEHPVYVLKPQLIKGNIPSDAGSSPFDIDKVTDDLHDAIGGIEDFTNEEFADRVLSSGERVSLRRDLEAVEVIFQSLKGSYDKLLVNPFITESALNNLTAKYNAVKSAKDSLFIVINSIIDGDDIVTPEEIASKDSVLSSFNSALYDYNQAEKELQKVLGEDYTQKINVEKNRVDEILSDNVADPSEKQYLSNLWQEIFVEYPKMRSQAATYGVSKTTYESKYSALNNLLSPVLADLATSTTINGASIRTAFSQYYDARTALQNAITNKVNQNTGDAAAAAADALAKANEASQDVSDLNGIVNDLDTYVDGAFHDGVIEEAEAKAIETYINQINSEKASLEATYNKLYVNPYLSGTPKTNLLNAKITYFGTVDNLISSINSVIADGKVTASEKQSIDAIFNGYRTNKAALSTRIEEANKAIQDYLKSNADAIDAKVNIAKAITDKFGTTVDGGLISTVITEYRELDSPQVTGLISGIQGTNKDLPFLVAGGTYNDALSGTAKAIIRHDGSGQLAGENILWNNLGDTLFKGALASPFQRAITSSSEVYNNTYSNNLIVKNGTYYLPWDDKSSGRTIKLIMPRPGTATCTAPTNFHFYEDGVEKSSLKLMGSEIVEILGYVDANNNFIGWLVLSRGLMKTVSTWGEPHRIVAYGYITDSAIKYRTFDGQGLTVQIITETGTGYKTAEVTMPEDWFDYAEGYYVNVTSNNNLNTFHNQVEKISYKKFRIYSYKTASRNPVSLSQSTYINVYFEVFSAAWLYGNSSGSGEMPGEDW